MVLNEAVGEFQKEADCSAGHLVSLALKTNRQCQSLQQQCRPDKISTTPANIQGGGEILFLNV